MSMSGRQTRANVPTMPTGVEVASYKTYLEAQKAVDHLSDKAFPVQYVTIVGTDLRMVERITGRLTYARVAGAGAMSGAWFGLLISLLLWMFLPDGQFPLLAGVLMGAAFGILAAVVSYALTGGKRDFTSASQVVASRYAVLCESEHAADAGRILTEGGYAGRVRQATGPTTPTGSGTAGSPGQPQYGVNSPQYGANPPQYGTNPPQYGATAHGEQPGPGQPDQPTGPYGTNPPPGPQPGGSPARPQGGSGTTPSSAPSSDDGRSERPKYGLRLEDLEGQGPSHQQDNASGEAGSRG